MNYGVAISSSWYNSISNLETGITIVKGIMGIKVYCFLLKVNTLNGHGQANLHIFFSRATPRFPHGWLEISNSLGYPHYSRPEW